jgi:hypothetical protein
LRRKRAPMGGYCEPVWLEAWWRAGHKKDCCVCGKDQLRAGRRPPEDDGAPLVQC